MMAVIQGDAMIPGQPDSPDKIFDSLWRNAAGQGSTFEPPSVWVETVVKELAPGPGRTILEVGSGSGKISLELSKAGALTVLLDKSVEAVKSSARLYSGNGQMALHTIGDLFELPYFEGTFDAVWSSGVLEHFDRQGTKAAIREMCRVCKKDGTVLVMVPSARAVIYRLGKWLQERRGTWQYGYERPIWSLRGSLPPQWRCVREYQIDPMSQLDYLPLIGKRALRAILQKHLHSTLVRCVVGGYLLVSVLRSAPTGAGSS
jgi:ubiquinone/menaquinone biosynthesis C-methylase UbiE